MTNPDPARITDSMWKLWTDRPNPNWKLGGIYADKPHYHNTVKANQSKWPNDYSVKLPLDLNFGNLDKARAIDVTMSDSEMVLWTKYMRDSALDPNDNRLQAVREFYGTLDNKTVYGLIKDDLDGPWRRSSADKSHLWHGHMGIFTKFVNNWNMLRPALSVWYRETLEEWTTESMFPHKNDSGEEVKYWQLMHNQVRKTVSIASPELTADGDYGDATVAAFTDFAKKSGASGQYVADRITGWLALKYTNAATSLAVSKVTVPPPINPAQMAELVNTWLTEKITTSMKVTGELNGYVEVELHD